MGTKMQQPDPFSLSVNTNSLVTFRAVSARLNRMLCSDVKFARNHTSFKGGGFWSHKAPDLSLYIRLLDVIPFTSSEKKPWLVSGFLAIKWKETPALCLPMIPGFVTDLRSGPSFVDAVAPNYKLWGVWLTHDILGARFRDAPFSFDDTQQILNSLLREECGSVARDLIVNATTLAKRGWWPDRIHPRYKAVAI